MKVFTSAVDSILCCYRSLSLTVQLAVIVRDSIRIELAEQDKKFVLKEDLHEAIKDFSKKDDLEVALTSLSE